MADRLGARLPEPDDASGIDVRRRCYRTGRDWCLLLDRLAGPGWSARLPEGPDEPMPALTDLVATVAGGSDGESGDDVWQAGLASAATAIAAERARRVDRLDALRRSGNGTIAIRGTPETPLLVTGFGPMNLTTLPGGIVIHERHVTLTLAGTNVTVLGQPTVTTAAGDYPLFSGVTEAEVLVDGQFLADDRALSRDVLAALGVRIAGPFRLRWTSPYSVEIAPSEPSVGVPP